MDMTRYTPPSNVEMEQCVLGCVIKSEEAAEKVFFKLKAEDFYDPSNRVIYRTILELHNAHKPIDLMTIDSALTDSSMIDSVGGAAYLITLASKVPSAVNAGAYADEVKEKSRLRSVIKTMESVLQKCVSGDSESKNILEDAEKDIMKLSSGDTSNDDLKPAGGEMMLRTFEKIEDLMRHKGELNGITSGFRDLDTILTGFHGGEFILIAGRPAMGKTSIGMNIATNAALIGHKKVAVFSLEMPEEQIIMRMLCSESNVDLHDVKSGTTDDEQLERISEAMMAIGSADIFIDCSSGIGVSDIRRKARKRIANGGLDMIVIDYLSLLTDNSKRFASRQEEVSQISRSLKTLALELNIPIIVLQQLSRAPTGRTDHRPMLSDIRESGAIEQDADVVMFIHREEYYDQSNEAEKNKADLIVAKQRNGSLGDVKLGWNSSMVTFMNLPAFA